MSNLFVTADSGLTTEQLRRQLLALAAARGAPYAVVVRRIADPGAMGADPMAFLEAMASAMGEGPKFGAAVAVKLFPDGREELIRGANIAGLTPASFREILAASRTRTIGTVPIEAAFVGSFAIAMMRRGGMSFDPSPGYTASFVVPSLLFEEVSLRPGGSDGLRPPLLGPPWAPDR